MLQVVNPFLTLSKLNFSQQKKHPDEYEWQVIHENCSVYGKVNSDLGVTEMQCMVLRHGLCDGFVAINSSLTPCAHMGTGPGYVGHGGDEL